MPGTLYLVATPIGNPADLSPRARSILDSVHVIAAEDTRIARTLFQRTGLSAAGQGRGERSLLSYHDHNEEGRTPQLLERLENGDDIALISDAGTPLVSDPGFTLLRAALDAGISVVPIPGPCAAVTALSVAGLPPDRFAVLGFPPRKGGNRRAWFDELKQLPLTLVFYESPHRIVGTLEDALQVLGDRPAALARSLTKDDEEVLRGSLSELIARLRQRLETQERIYGELTVVVSGGEKVPASQEAVDRAIRRLLAEGLSVKQVRDVVADLYELPRREVYQRVLELRD